eukprot:TRINITY_DN15243_c0_g1_i1.p1 TRINITY_DN15243_c0_g1~~TRINITY_DN15243_c0_g1_i1.p1  ORF type:complete len:313 (+),score=88.39 TRINITY_DN15243_c0_g1_i1:674-1612(+)
MADPQPAASNATSGARIIDGKAIGQAIHAEVAKEVEELKSTYGKVPGLAVIIVGERKDSQTYVRMKRKACEEVGIFSVEKRLPQEATQAEVLDAVRECNDDPAIHGILVQLPLPAELDEEAVLAEVSLAKDVDGFHPINIGKLCMKGRKPLFVPCTPEGCIELLVRSGIPIAGRRAVVVGRSNIVGMPAALLLNERDATVTIVHSRTPDPAAVVRQADIVIVAAGQANMVKSDWLKPGAAVVDVGINPVEDASRKSGFRLVGDVDYEAVRKVAGWVTPVPGGVGPMTIAMLLRHTLQGAKRALEKAAGGDPK